MKITELKCKACNGTLKLDKTNSKIAVCEYCNTKYVLEEEQDGGVHFASSQARYEVPRELRQEEKKTGWEPYGWKRMTAAITVGILILIPITLLNAKSKNNQKEIPKITVEKERPIIAEKKTEEFTGIFADMAAEVLKKPIEDLTEEDLLKFQWIELEYTTDKILIAYSFDNPYESSEASLTWLEFEYDRTKNINQEQLYRFTNLKKLNIQNYISEKIVKGLKLEGLSCYSKSLEELANLLEEPERLKEIEVLSGLENLSGLEKFTNLEYLTLDGNNLTDIKNLVNLKNLKKLTLLDCDQTTDFSVFSVMPWLEELYIESEGIKDISFIRSMANLTSFSLKDAKILNLNPLKENKTLTSLCIQSCNELKDCSAINSLTNLKNLSLKLPYNCEKPDLSNLTNIESLSISGMDSIRFLNNMKKLSNLTISSCTIDDNSVFTKLTNLKQLKCSYITTNQSGWKFIENIPTLEILDLKGVSTYEDISGVFNITSLRELYLNGVECEINFSNLIKNQSLEILEMDGIKLYTNVKIDGGNGIISVYYDDVTLDEHTNFLNNYANLKHLSLADNTLTQIDFAAKLLCLETINISDNYVTDLNPLKSLTALTKVDCKNNPIENYRVLAEDIIIIQ